MPQGAEIIGDGVHFRTWAAGHQHVDVIHLDSKGTITATTPLYAEPDGYFSGFTESAKAGDLYKYRIDRAGIYPDPRSRYQPQGVHGPSAVIDPLDFCWTDAGFVAPAQKDLVIYELHVGTFTPDGTFRSAIERLNHVTALGATAIEIMPVADFPGRRNWGYDGVMLYAPARVYGSPNDLRALVSAAHERGLAVILDVVYNHLGPDGNYLGVFSSAYRDSSHQTPWGAAFDLQRPAVRELFIENPVYWMREFHIDGFRLDATHQIHDRSKRHLLSDIADAVHERGGFVMGEDDRNSPALISPASDGGLGLDGVWADDFHHAVRVSLTGEQDAYFADYGGTSHELCEILSHGWLYRGQPRRRSGVPRGGYPSGLPVERFIYCISNHDQVGNRARGERLPYLVSPAAYRAASALLCLTPYTPLLFMGQEWAASTPFLFFTDHNQELGRKVTLGRREEFRHFPEFRSPESLNAIPDPQREETFLGSKLQWDELSTPDHAQTLALYREALRLRKTISGLRCRSRDSFKVAVIGANAVAIRYGIGDDNLWAVVVSLTGGGLPALDQDILQLPSGRTWKTIFSSEEERFGGTGASSFAQPFTVLLQAN
jgi:maltooligosyltrehalose trehalohydrolase